jgi:hypothetical protein
MRRFFHSRQALLIAIVAAAFLSAAGPVRANVILAGNSNASTFSNCTGCGSDSTATSLDLGGFRLTIHPISFSISSDTAGLILAEVDLTTANNPTGDESFNYNLSLNFTTPANVLLGDFAVGVLSGGHGVNSTETLTGFSFGFAWSYVVPNIGLANFRFIDIDNGATGNFSNGSWTVTGHDGTSSIVLEADATVTDPSATVPEPASAALLGTALLAFGASRRGKRACRRP